MRRERWHPQTYQSQVNPNDYLRRGEYSPMWRLLELVAYINISGRPSRRKRSERRDSDVHGRGVIKFAGGMIKLWGCGGNAPSIQYSTRLF
jgi:hypothetical protein